MKISVITVCLNSAATIRETLDSVLAQDHPDVEYIVVDGGSTDGTLDILAQYAGRIHRLLHGPDQGLYDALNKGIAAASGEIIGVLHADDRYAANDVLGAVAKGFLLAPGAQMVFGDVAFVGARDPERVVRYYGSAAFRSWKLRFGWMPPHPATFVRKSAYATIGPYATDLRVSSDFEMFVKALVVHRMQYARLDRLLVRMRLGGISTSGLRMSMKLNLEIVRACRRNGLYTNIALVLLKVPFKVLEYIRIPANLRRKSTHRPAGARSVALFTCFEWVSISTSVINTARFLAAKGYEVDLYLMPGGRFGEPAFSEQAIRKILVESKPFPIGQLNYLWARWRQGRNYRFAIGFDPLGLIAAWAQRLVFGTPYAYHSLEILCISAQSSWKLRLLKRIERWAARRALLCLTQDASRGGILAGDLGVSPGSIGIALNSPIGPALPQRGGYLQRKLGIDGGKTLVLAIGSLMRETWIDKILDAVDNWPAQCVLVLHGWFPDSDFAKQVLAAAARRPGRVFVSNDLLPDAEKYQAFQSAAIGLVCYEPADDNLKYAAGSSGKLYDFMRVGVPVIANDIPGMRDLVEGNSCGIVVQSAGLIGQAIGTMLAGYPGYRQAALAAYEHNRFDTSYQAVLPRIESSLPQGEGR